MKIASSIPVLRMLDEAASLAFYVTYLGYAIEWTHRFHPEIPNSPAYLQLRLGDSLLHLNGHAEADAPTSEVRIPVEGLSDFAALLGQRDPQGKVPEIVDPRYEGRRTDLNLLDPSGNTLTFWADD